MPATQAWFTGQTTNLKELFAPINELWENRNEWAISAVEPSDSFLVPRKHHTRGYGMSIYECTRQDVQSLIDAFSETSGAKITSQAQATLELAGFSKSQWEHDRKSSATRKAGALFQHSMTAFSHFLSGFSGIVEIAKGADSQYGGLAYGTLSVFLAVFMNKTKREEALDEGLSELGYAFPRLHTLQSLRHSSAHDDPVQIRKLEALIVLTFSLIIQYAREATVYYKSGQKRMKNLFVAEKLDRKTEILHRIRKTLEEIRNDCDILLLTKITSLQTMIEDMSIVSKTTYNETVNHRRQLTHFQSSSDKAHLSELRRILAVQEKSAHTDLEKYKSLLDSVYGKGGSLRSKYYYPATVTLELLKAEREFREWWDFLKPCILIAGGMDYIEDYSSGSLTWVSYAAILTVEELQRLKKPVAFYLAQTTLTTKSPRSRCPSRNVIQSLIYQIAAMHGDLVRSKVDAFQKATENSEWKDGGARFMRRAQKLMLEILSEFSPEEQITIVVDRLDQCAWEVGEEGEEGLDLRHAIEGLLHVAVTAAAGCRVKVLLTMDSGAARKIGPKTGFPKKQRNALLLKPEWCQPNEDGDFDE